MGAGGCDAPGHPTDLGRLALVLSDIGSRANAVGGKCLRQHEGRARAARSKKPRIRQIQISLELPGFDPFAAETGGEPARLLLVACNRPADAITALGDLSCQLPVTVISAVLRSWEARFAASVVEVGHATLVLAVAAPPQDGEQALAIAAEMVAFCPPEDMLHAGDLKALAGGLLGTPPPGPARCEPWRPDRWAISFE